MPEQEKCGVCGCPLRMKVVTDSVDGKKAVMDCPRCNPASFGLPVRVKNTRAIDLPV
jgi:hypothetical protein